MTPELEQLKALAEAAIPGPWIHHTDEDYVAANATYIAAANPERILALIAENERLAAKVKMMLGEDCEFKLLPDSLRAVPACKFYQAENERLTNSRKDAEPVAWQGRVWYMEPDNCWSSWRDIPDSDLPFWRERITAGSKRELRALFTHPPEADKPVLTKNQALNIQRFADEFGYDYGKLSIVVANVGFAPGEGPSNEAIKLLQQALEALTAMQMEAKYRNCGLKICDDSIDAIRTYLEGEYS